MKGWIRAVDEEYGGDEKGFIDDLLSVPENDGVIDLEMGLPAWSGNSVAVRMDLVAVERVSGPLTVFFGEVKLVTGNTTHFTYVSEVIDELSASLHNRFLR
ncbi:hypothetical protein [Bradyrhizobium elkanii]|uniref:hypothetical protein n=1 Tax=Bradyrhizobium elkanii TaxID=29448 RepID=UPI0020A1A8DA|nr:hypothetical protein [Bradyrhizobium elkanii]MCP1973901.1 hypothetical protein [Bradyrhizobium elkanii]MCS4104594.1 hypothetical protein [Bradyrhizobium elkanii]